MQQMTHIEVVLGDWQKLPDECLAWSEEWKYVNGGIYAIAQAELTRELSADERTLLIELKVSGKIVDGSSRLRAVESVPVKVVLPDWAEP
ncbi:MAG TPA: hypothetical protein VGU68_09470 [Ktedonobacteraceae bacterium]|nr:hypothetical protein [Ktedonobacteraceae bacterium]